MSSLLPLRGHYSSRAFPGAPVQLSANRVEVEVQKTEDERGKYLHPEEHGQPATAGIIQIELPVSEETEPNSGKLQGE